jgi:hypothetical protein
MQEFLTAVKSWVVWGIHSSEDDDDDDELGCGTT